MKVKGQSGTLYVGGRVAARLGAYAFERDPGSDSVELQARLLSHDAFLITQKPMQAELDFSHSRRRVQVVRVEGASAHITIDWKGAQA